MDGIETMHWRLGVWRARRGTAKRERGCFTFITFTITLVARRKKKQDNKTKHNTTRGAAADSWKQQKRQCKCFPRISNVKRLKRPRLVEGRRSINRAFTLTLAVALTMPLLNSTRTGKATAGGFDRDWNCFPIWK
jgi:hypothetical protein